MYRFHSSVNIITSSGERFRIDVLNQDDVIGLVSSMFGCPYNFYPEKPWLRRTIRGMIATGVVVASPVIVAGAVTAAVTVLPPLGVYKLLKHIRSRRQAQVAARFPIGEPFLIEPDLNDPRILAHAAFEFELHGDLLADDIMRVLRQRIEGLSFPQTIDVHRHEPIHSVIDLDFPLSIFADMDIEHLFADDDDDAVEHEESLRSPADFRTCPTTPACAMRKGHSRSLTNLKANPCASLHRHHSITAEP